VSQVFLQTPLCGLAAPLAYRAHDVNAPIIGDYDYRHEGLPFPALALSRDVGNTGSRAVDCVVGTHRDHTREMGGGTAAIRIQ
jgi:hypothetical protein